MLPATGAAVCLPPPTTFLGQPSGDLPGPATEPGITAASIVAASSGPPAASSPCCTDPGSSGTSLPPGQVSPPVVPSEQPLPDGMDDFSDITDSTSGTIIYGNENASQDEKCQPFQPAVPEKRHRASKRSYRPLDMSAVPSPLRHGVVVVVKPLDSSKIITHYNPLVLKEGLESLAPGGVLQVRPNYRLNLLAIDTRNADATERLLKISSIAGIKVQAYEPRPSNCGVGVIRGVATDLSNQDILNALRLRVPVKSARRLGKTSESVQIVFGTETIPEHVIIGYTRYRVYNYVETPRQCKKCQRFGHVSEVCKSSLRCSRCGGSHDRTGCSAEKVCCPNCSKKHESTSAQCSARRDQKAIFKLKSANNTDYKSAKSSFMQGRRTGRKEAWTMQTAGPFFKNAEEDFPALPVLQRGPKQPPPAAPALAERSPAAQHAPTPRHAEPPASTGVPVIAPATTPTAPSSAFARRASLQHQREPKDERNTGGLCSVLSSLIEALRILLAPLSSPIAAAVLTLLDFVSPLLAQWR